MPPILQYSNGWGHLIMSVCTLVVAVILLLQHDAVLNGIAIGAITTVQGYWFVTSSANTIKQAQSTQATMVVSSPAPNIVVSSPLGGEQQHDSTTHN